MCQWSALKNLVSNATVLLYNRAIFAALIDAICRDSEWWGKKEEKEKSLIKEY